MSSQTESFFVRHRRGLVIAAWVAGVVGTVVLYNSTGAKPTVPAGSTVVADAPTLQVGALPVT